MARPLIPMRKSMAGRCRYTVSVSSSRNMAGAPEVQ
jgi:hypothetical protein